MCREEKSLIFNFCRNYSVTLLIINLHSLLPDGRQVVSLCFRMHKPGWELWWWDFFFSSEKGTEDKERIAGSIPPSAVNTYLYKHWHWEDKWPESTVWLPALVWGKKIGGRDGELGLQQLGFQSLQSNKFLEPGSDKSLLSYLKMPLNLNKIGGILGKALICFLAESWMRK